MKFRFTIGKKIALGFGVIVFLTILSFFFTNLTLNTSRDKTTEVTEIYNPSVTILKELDNLLNLSRLGVTEWYTFPIADLPQKKSLTKLIHEDYPQLRAKIMELSLKWTVEEQESISTILSSIDHILLKYQEHIMTKLSSMEDYNDGLTIFEAGGILEDS